MFDYNYTSSENRAPGGLEIALRAREKERKLEIRRLQEVGDLGREMEKAGAKQPGLIARLLKGLHIL